MYNNPYFIPGFNPNYINPNLIRGAGTAFNGVRGLATPTLSSTVGKTGLLSKLTGGLSSIKRINWGGLINNTSKTLGIINQTIPIVRQVGPMVTNMKSMIRVASIFKDETDIPRTKPRTQVQNKNIQTNNTQHNQVNETSYTKTTTEEYTESPTFFINT